MTIERTDPTDVYTPVNNAYTQVIETVAEQVVFVAGTVPENEQSELVGVGDMDAQIKQVMTNIERSLATADATLTDVVRLRTFTTDMDAYRAADRSVLGYFPTNAKPTSTLVGVDQLADTFDGTADENPADVEPRYLIEVDVTAILD